MDTMNLKATHHKLPVANLKRYRARIFLSHKYTYREICICIYTTSTLSYTNIISGVDVEMDIM